jgi:hypothetical protein
MTANPTYPTERQSPFDVIQRVNSFTFHIVNQKIALIKTAHFVGLKYGI